MLSSGSGAPNTFAPTGRAPGPCLRFVDFFAGIGGFRLGLERSGHECVAACELAEFPRRVYAHHWHEPEFGDLRAIKPADIPEAEIWCGGFPCQDVSSAGKGAGLLGGERSMLVWRLLGLAAVARPTWILMENVRGLLVRGRGFGRLLGVLARLGYRVAWRPLDAQCFGVAQQRRRIFLLARLAGAPGPCPGACLLESARVQGAAGEGGASGADGAGAAARSPGAARTRLACTGRRRVQNDTFVVHSSGSNAKDSNGGWGGAAGGTLVLPFDRAHITSPDNRSRPTPGRPAYTLAATSRPAVAYVFAPEFGQGADLRATEADHSPALAPSGRHDRGVRVVEGCRVRILLPVEWERLFGFPDGWTAIEGASDSKRYEALGNSVAVPVVEWIGRRLREVTH